MGYSDRDARAYSDQQICMELDLSPIVTHVLFRLWEEPLRKSGNRLHIPRITYTTSYSGPSRIFKAFQSTEPHCNHNALK